ncbi:hypothetical protein ACFVWL_06545 [Microbacterium sp. NPDC058269]|uniref:hypothetical protein n=1 Tax=Microbacterium sp. NPDC058269 TaxID=3346414 RepID=UPI0036DD93F0
MAATAGHSGTHHSYTTGHEHVRTPSDGGHEVAAPRGGSGGINVRSRNGRVDSPVIDENEIHRSVERLVSTAQGAGAASAWVSAILQEVTDLVKAREPIGAGLTEAEADYLVRSGAFTPEQFAGTERRVATGVLASQERDTRMRAITRTLTTDQVAEKLGIDSSRVRHRQAKNGLYGFLVGRARLYPEWQFIDGTKMVLPHLSTVVNSFPEGWHAASVEGFMTTPQESLRGEGTARLTPTEWLLIGGDPDSIVAILNGIKQR